MTDKQQAAYTAAQDKLLSILVYDEPYKMINAIEQIQYKMGRLNEHQREILCAVKEAFVLMENGGMLTKK